MPAITGLLSSTGGVEGGAAVSCAPLLPVADIHPVPVSWVVVVVLGVVVIVVVGVDESDVVVGSSVSDADGLVAEKVAVSVGCVFGSAPGTPAQISRNLEVENASAFQQDDATQRIVASSIVNPEVEFLAHRQSMFVRSGQTIGG